VALEPDPGDHPTLDRPPPNESQRQRTTENIHIPVYPRNSPNPRRRASRATSASAPSHIDVLQYYIVAPGAHRDITCTSRLDQERGDITRACRCFDLSPLDRATYYSHVGATKPYQLRKNRNQSAKCSWPLRTAWAAVVVAWRARSSSISAFWVAMRRG
jgi:hypothetical protein